MFVACDYVWTMLAIRYTDVLTGEGVIVLVYWLTDGVGVWSDG